METSAGVRFEELPLSRRDEEVSTMWDLGFGGRAVFGRAVVELRVNVLGGDLGVSWVAFPVVRIGICSPGVY